MGNVRRRNITISMASVSITYIALAYLIVLDYS